MNKKPYDDWAKERIDNIRDWWVTAIPIVGWLSVIIVISFAWPIGYVWGCENKKSKKKKSCYDKYLCRWLEDSCNWRIFTIPIIGWVGLIFAFGYIIPCYFMFGDRK